MKGKSSEEESREKIIIKRYDQLIGEVDHNEAEIRKFMDSEVLFHQNVNFANCHEFFSTVTQRLKKFAG